LIHADLKGIGWSPPDVLAVKWRILATADPLEESEPSSRFGRINFARALSFDTDTVKRYLSGRACNDCTVSGSINRNDTRHVINFQNGSPILFNSILRIIREHDGTVTVYWLQIDPRGANLVATHHLTLAEPEDSLYVQPSSGDSIRIKLKEIEDLVSCSFGPSCAAGK
jgi:hypothetical protein